MNPEVAAGVLQAILNAIWQTAALAGAAALFVRAARPNAATRHAVFTLTLLAVLVVPCLSAGRWLPARAAAASFGLSGTSVSEAVMPGPAAPAVASVPPQPGRRGAAPGAAEPLVPFAVASRWAVIAVAGVALVAALRTLRVLLGIIALRRLASSCRPLDPRREAKLTGWSRLRVRGRCARLCSSPDVGTPVLVGLVRPVIAVPQRLLRELSDLELDQVALHELAHVRRRDDWSALGEKLIAALLFFQPAVHWIVRRLEREREMACDEWVVAATGARRPYAACLLRLGEWVSADAVTFLAPSAGTRRVQLSRRIEALVAAAGTPNARLSRTSLAAVVAGLSAGAAGLLGASPAVTVQARAAETAPVSTAVERVSEESLRAETAAAIQQDDTSGEDAAARRIALSALGARAGTVVVMEPRTGRVLTIVNQEWAVRRGTSPASTIKLVTGLAALRAHTLDAAAKVAVTHPRPGELDFEGAIALSSNDYFSAAGRALGFERFVGCARELGLGEPTGIDLPGEYAGRLPTESGWSFTTGGGVEVTPIQLATLVSAIANGGALLTPRHATASVAPQVRRRVEMPEEALARVRAAMVAAVAYGTGGPARQERWKVAGKTGTWDQGALRTGVFVSFAPAEDPALVVVALLRGKDELGANAAALAGQIYAGLSDDRTHVR